MKRKSYESEAVEEKSQFTGSKAEWLRLVKTMVALSNTKGGVIRLLRVKIDQFQFDSAKMDDKVNRYVEPRVQNIRTEILKSYIKIMVEDSPAKPHVFKMDGAYQNLSEPSRLGKEFYKGQVLVRHSSKNEVAMRDDYERIFEERSDKLMDRVQMVSQLPLDKPVTIKESKKAFPIKIVKKGEGLPVLLKETDPEKDYPHLTTDLAVKLGKSVNFVARAAAVLKLKGNKKYHLSLKTSHTGKTHKYSDSAVHFLRWYLKKHSEFNPFHKI